MRSIAEVSVKGVLIAVNDSIRNLALFNRSSPRSAKSISNRASLNRLNSQ